MTLHIQTTARVTTIAIARPHRRNAVDVPTAQALFDAFAAFEADPGADVAILTGEGGHFCAGADLQAIAAGEQRAITEDGALAPMGPTRMLLGKPVIAAIEGYAVAGGLELAAWCDLRVAGESAVLGVFCRRVGVPLIDLGTIRLPRLIGHSRALDMILTGREVRAPEALQWGLVNRVTADGQALTAAQALAETLCRFPQNALRGDRLSAYAQWDLPMADAIANEVRLGRQALPQGVQGAARFTADRAAR